jgi:hypothetical protein
MQSCMRNPRIAFNTNHVLQHRWEKQNESLKMEARLKILITNNHLYDPHGGQSNHTNFRPILSHATVPLKASLQIIF